MPAHPISMKAPPADASSNRQLVKQIHPTMVPSSVLQANYKNAVLARCLTWTWNSSLMRSSGAVTVRATAPAEPPARNILQDAAAAREMKPLQ